MQSNRKSVAGKQHPDRDGQSQFIDDEVRQATEDRQSIVAVDTKKKRTWVHLRMLGANGRPRAIQSKSTSTTLLTQIWGS